MPISLPDHGHEHGAVALPAMPAEADAFAATMMAEPGDSQPHGAGSSMAPESMRPLQFDPRGEARSGAVA